MTLTLGIDDAGRGPIIGPMLLAGVLVNPAQETLLKENEVNDSKQLYHHKRIKLDKIIKAHSLKTKIVLSKPEEIDNSLNTGTNLNTLEAIKTAEIINEINKGKFLKERIKVIVDCPSVNTTAWKNTLMKFIKTSSNLTVLCEHKADENHISVSAASILAKVAREEEVGKLKKEFGEIGSGYPSDPTTKLFLKNFGQKYKDRGIFRKTWSTWKKLFPESKKQTTLESF